MIYQKTKWIQIPLSDFYWLNYAWKFTYSRVSASAKSSILKTIPELKYEYTLTLDSSFFQTSQKSTSLNLY